MGVQLIVDSACDIELKDVESMGLILLPMTVTIDSREYVSCFELTAQDFYQKLETTKEFPTTSQIPPAVFEEVFCKVIAKGDTPVVITVSSKLSGTYQSACIARESVEGQVFVVDSMNVTVGQALLVHYAHGLVKQGLSGEEVAEELNRVKDHVRLFAMVDTLEYLKKGGRISAATAFFGTALSVKPILEIRDGEVQMLDKARGVKNGYRLLNEKIMNCRGMDKEKPLLFGYAGLSDAPLQDYMNAYCEMFGEQETTTKILPIGAVIGSHVGPGAVVVAFFEKE